MAKNASHYVPTLRAGTEKIPADLLDLDGLEAGEVTIGDVEGLTDALAGKAAASHTHTAAQVTDLDVDAVEGLTAALAGKAAASHTHDIADVTSLQDALDGKQAAGSYAAASHTHTAAQVDVAADAENGLSAGTLQAALESLAARVQALEDAAAEA